MEFIEDNQIREWCAERGIPCDDEGKPPPEYSIVESKLFGHAAEPRGQESAIAAWCVQALGRWDECLLWITLWGVWPSSEDWPTYYAARGMQGERRSIGVAPGHLFARGEEDLLTQFVELTLLNAWNAHVVPVSGGIPTRRRLLISHDEYIEILERPNG